jgi:teichuronic acid biosynthesis glycosyltransferase TuaC
MRPSQSDGVAPHAGGTLVLTTSYPAFPGDFSGHFVAAEVEALALDGSVVVAAAGGGTAASELPNVEVRWLGGASLCSFPGALVRARANPLRLLQAPLIVWRAWRALLGHRGTVEAHWILPFGYLAALSTRWTSSNLTVTSHGSDVRLLCRGPRWLRTMVVWELKRADAKLTLVSHELKAELMAGLPPRLQDYLQDAGIKPARLDLSRAPRSRMEARRRLQLAESELVLVIVGRLIPSKRVRVALTAATLTSDAAVVCVGDGPCRSDLVGEFPEVHFVGSCDREEALAWIGAADLLLSASRVEGAPTVVREALALGSPVVSTASGDLRAWAKDHPELYVVD